MAEKDVKKKISDANLERAYNSGHEVVFDPKETFNEYLHYLGKRFDEKSGKMMKVSDIINREISDVVQSESEKLKTDLQGKEHDEKAISEKLFEMGKKAYMANQGIKDEKAFKKLVGETQFYEKVKNFIAQVTRSDSYEEVLAQILEQDTPYRMSEENPLANIVQIYSRFSHESDLKGKDGKSLTVQRRDELRQKLDTHKFHKNLYKDHVQNIMQKHTYEGLKFSEAAGNKEIMDTLENVLAGDELNTKAKHFKGNKIRNDSGKQYSEAPHDEYKL